MENLSDIVGQNLTALRKAKGLTQQEVALKIEL
jgi:transcriptional regulator with XRE-family HTH domain